MSGVLEMIKRLFDDPPPEYVFEIGSGQIAWARRKSGRSAFDSGVKEIDQDVLAISPAHDNVLRPEAFGQAVSTFAPPPSRKRPGAVLILPDYCGRVTVLDFDELPKKEEEQLSLVKFRLKKSVPFDVDQASISFFPQPRTDGQKIEVVVAVIAQEILARYEAPFRASGFWPGWITTSTLAACELMPTDGVSLLLKQSGGVLTAAVFRGSTVKMVRTVELMEVSPYEVAQVLFPTMAYLEDEWKIKPQRLVLCGFHRDLGMEEYLNQETGLPVEPLRGPVGLAGEASAGIQGFLTAKGAV